MAEAIVFILIGFLCGSLMFCKWLPKRRCGIDIVAESEDGNPGTFNVFRLCGKKIGILCLLLELGKGFVPIVLASMYLYGRVTWEFSLVMLAPVLGHAFSPWMSFHGGKSIAVSFGVLMGVLPVSKIVFSLVLLYIFFSIILIIDPHGARSIVTFACMAVFGFLFEPEWAVALGAILIAVTVILRHFLARSAHERLTVTLLHRKIAEGHADAEKKAENSVCEAKDHAGENEK